MSVISFARPTKEQLQELSFGAPLRVDLWRGSLEQSPSIVAHCRTLLSEDERERSLRFTRDDLQQRYVLARGGLRLLLAVYLKCAPATLQFAYNAYGWPELASESQSQDIALRFNLSHSHNEVLYAVSNLPAVGVDVERHRKEDRLHDLAKRYFAAEEQQAWEALPAEQQVAGFFAAWTRKEAYIKAHGRGLSYPLDQFVVSLVPGEPAKLLATLDNPLEAKRWRVEDIPYKAGYSAAVVATAGDWSVQGFELQTLFS